MVGAAAVHPTGLWAPPVEGSCPNKGVRPQPYPQSGSQPRALNAPTVTTLSFNLSVASLGRLGLG